MSEVEKVDEQQIQETSGEVADDTTTSGVEDVTEAKPTEVTEEAIDELDAKSRELQSEYDRKVALINKFDEKLSELQQQYPNMSLDATDATQTEPQQQVADDYDEYITKRDLETFAEKIIGKVNETSTRKELETAQSFLAETFHGYGFMEKGEWKSDETSQGAAEIARNAAATLAPGTPPAKAAAFIKYVVDGYYARQKTAADEQRAQEKGAKDALLQKQLARPEVAPAPAQTKQEIDPDLADILEARKLSGLG